MEPTIEELNMLPSIWDGWEKQCRFLFGGHGGPSCAQGWLGGSGHVAATYNGTYARIARYLRDNYSIPRGAVRIYPDPEDRHYSYSSQLFQHGQHLDMAHDGQVIAYANNELKLTPDDFRRIDRLTQWQALQEARRLEIDALPLTEQVEAL